MKKNLKNICVIECTSKPNLVFFKITKQDARKLKYYYVKRDEKFGEKSRGRI